MKNSAPEIIPYDATYLHHILDLSIRAWEPVFPLMQQGIPDYVYGAFYPDGWETRQVADIKTMLLDDETHVWLALMDGQLCGYVGLRVHQEDSMGEVYILAVDPDFQKQGIGTALLNFGFEWMQQRGLAMAMVETGGDGGHAPSRATYESVGFERYPVARYFRRL